MKQNLNNPMSSKKLNLNLPKVFPQKKKKNLSSNGITDEFYQTVKEYCTVFQSVEGTPPQLIL